MAVLTTALAFAVALVMIESSIELGFVSSTVSWLHSTASQGFLINHNGAVFRLAGIPRNFLEDQGHTSNGAAGTGLVLIGFGGILAFLLRTRAGGRRSLPLNFIYYVWLVVSVLALMLTIGALGYVFNVTNAHAGQTIDVSLASALKDGAAYPLDTWTPQNWFSALLELNLVDARSDVESRLRIIRGWQYNLIPMFIIQLAQTVLAIAEFVHWRNSTGPAIKHERGMGEYA